MLSSTVWGEQRIGEVDGRHVQVDKSDGALARVQAAPGRARLGGLVQVADVEDGPLRVRRRQRPRGAIRQGRRRDDVVVVYL